MRLYDFYWQFKRLEFEELGLYKSIQALKAEHMNKNEVIQYGLYDLYYFLIPWPKNHIYQIKQQ